MSPVKGVNGMILETTHSLPTSDAVADAARHMPAGSPQDIFFEQQQLKLQQLAAQAQSADAVESGANGRGRVHRIGQTALDLVDAAAVQLADDTEDTVREILGTASDSADELTQVVAASELPVELDVQPVGRHSDLEIATRLARQAAALHANAYGAAHLQAAA